MADTRRPIHVGIVIGISTGMYAVALAGVTGLQSGQNAQLTADRGPAADVAASLEAADSDLEARLAAAQAAFDASASSYAAVADGLARYEAQLKALSTTVGGIRGSTIAIPAGGLLPHVSTASSGGSVAKPPVHSTTSASGH